MDLIQLENALILLDNNKIKYQSGETISGSVFVKLNGELELSRVNIVLRSMAEVQWVEMYGSIFVDGHAFRDNEMYLNVVYEIPDNISNTVITAGEHSIPFEFKLPDDTPSSIELNNGSIKYWIEVFITSDSVEKEVFRDKTYFFVESPIRYGLQLTVFGGTEKDYGLLSLGSGKILIDAIIRKKGYVAGETVKVKCLVTNVSTVSVTPRASFYQIQIFMAKERHITVENHSEPVLAEKVNAGETRDQMIAFHLPKDMLLSMKTRLITIKYFIHVTLDIPFAKDLHINLPIIITNVFA